MRAVAGFLALIVGLALMALATGADASPLGWHVLAAALGLFCIGAAGFLVLVEERA